MLNVWGDSDCLMIRRFSFSNFCSFLDKAEVDFTTSEKTPTDDSFVDTVYGDQVSLLMGVFGPNAAGKTNLLKALAFISFFLRGSYRNLKPGDLIPIDQFAGPSGKKIPTIFEVEFSLGDIRYHYQCAITSQKVIEETLKQYSAVTGQFKQVLSRKLGKDGELQLRAFDQFTEVSLLKEALRDRPNASMLAAGLQTGRREFAQVFRVLGSLFTNVDHRGKRDRPFEGLTGDLFACSEFFQNHPEHHDALRELLRAADVGIDDFRFQPIQVVAESAEARESFLIHFQHKGPKGAFELSAEKESSGTQRLFMLFQAFIEVLTLGGIVAIDEMESDLHPHLIPMILDLFNNPEMNPKQAQLFFTCHHVEMLNHLLKEQIILVEKNEQCLSESYRLDTLKGVRREENFFANYNSGRYGAIPEPEVVAF